MKFFRTPFFLPKIFPSLTWRIQTTDKHIYLTFDDGPIPGPTEFVLNTLSKFKAKATFFCIGDNVRKYPMVFKSIHESGHSFGNHTFNHLNGWKTATAEYVDNIGACNKEFIQNTNLSSNLFRPPYGKISSAQVRALNSYKVIMWDVLTYDYSRSGTNEFHLRQSIRATRNGSIVVFHDSLKANNKLTYILPRFLSHFSDLGFKFMALDQRQKEVSAM